MTWLGKKRLALVPVYRPHAAPPDQIPVDWPGDIMRRIYYDPQGGSDWSLRTYIHTVSYGRADLEAVVQPMVVVDRQDVLPDALDGQLGAQLRAQGYDAAAIVMLGGQGAGSSSGYWARFVMVEDVGVWAMEFMHILTGFADLYSLPPGICQPPDLGAFDQMCCPSCATHQTAYTKAAIGWLDASAVAKHVGRSVSYDLHTVGLVQPPPAGRWTAVRIGTQVPYLMVESRQKVDQFDMGIPSEGVIVYRIQTSNPLGWWQNNPIPVQLMTPTALTGGQSYTDDSGITVSVVTSLSGGFSIRIDDPSAHLVDRSAQYGTPPAAGAPTACVDPGMGVHDIMYCDTSGHLHELWRDAQGATGTTDLTSNAGAPNAQPSPFAYVNTNTNLIILLYRDGGGTVRSLYWTTGGVGADNLSGTAGAPPATGDPVGYYVPAADTHHVIYRFGNGHFEELWWTGNAPVAGGGDLIASASAPAAAGKPSAFVDGGGNHNVIYRDVNNTIHHLYWTTGAVSHEDLSGYAGTPPAAGDPSAYYTANNDTIQIAYVGNDGHIWELYWAGSAPVAGWDLTAASGAPAATGKPAAYYSAGTNTKHVMFRSADGRLHEIWWTPGGTPAWNDLTAAYGAPPAADNPAAFTVEGPNTQHVAYRGTDNHIYELIW